MANNQIESKYDLGFCVFFNAYIHGKDEDSSPNIDSHYLVVSAVNIHTFYDSIEFTNVMNMINMWRHHYCRYYQQNKRSIKHPVIRNYRAAVSKKNYISLEIIEYIELEGGEHVAIYKTFWLRIIQRKWKKYYHTKMEAVRKLLKPYGLLMREINWKNASYTITKPLIF
jgi:hypothetical protein